MIKEIVLCIIGVLIASFAVIMGLGVVGAQLEIGGDSNDGSGGVFIETPEVPVNTTWNQSLGDDTYLRLDTSNDPLTNELEIRDGGLLINQSYGNVTIDSSAGGVRWFELGSLNAYLYRTGTNLFLEEMVNYLTIKAPISKAIYIDSGLVQLKSNTIQFGRGNTQYVTSQWLSDTSTGSLWWDGDNEKFMFFNDISMQSANIDDATNITADAFFGSGANLHSVNFTTDYTNLAWTNQSNNFTQPQEMNNLTIYDSLTFTCYRQYSNGTDMFMEYTC